MNRLTLSADCGWIWFSGCDMQPYSKEQNKEHVSVHSPKSYFAGAATERTLLTQIGRQRGNEKA